MGDYGDGLSERLIRNGVAPDEATLIAGIVENEQGVLKAHANDLRGENSRLRAQLEASAYTYIGKDGKPVLARALEDERDNLRALLARAVEVTRGLLECPAIADGDLSNPEWGDSESAQAESAARAFITEMEASDE